MSDITRYVGTEENASTQSSVSTITRYVNAGLSISRQISTATPLVLNTGGSSNANQSVITPIPGLNASTVQDAIAILTPFSRTFTQADLSVAGILPCVHNLGTLIPTVEVWDDTGQRVNPDDVIPQGVNASGVDLNTYQPISGTWTIKIRL